MRDSKSLALARVGGLCAALILVAGCPAKRQGRVNPPPVPGEPAYYQSEVEEGIGAAVVILLDTSGSMDQVVGSRPKHRIAREAIERMLAATNDFVAKRPDFPIKVSLMHFASSVWIDKEMGPYDPVLTLGALERIPNPGGGTAIGRALQEARPALYRSGCFRKYILCVTDGENTSGVHPEPVAREMHQKSQGSVQIYFVAFDTDSSKFAFLKEVGGDVIEARDAPQLDAALKEIYEGRILAEAADYGETEIPPTSGGGR